MAQKKVPQPSKWHYLDYSILIPYLILCVIGIIMVYSSTSYLQYLPATKDITPFSYARNQTFFFFLSLVAIAFIFRMKTAILERQRLIKWVLIVIFGLLLLTRFSSFGVEVNGARGWLQLPGGFRLQPVEFLKIAVVWYLAVEFSRQQKMIKTAFFRTTKIKLLILAAFIGLVMLQPDLGGAIILILLIGGMMLVSGQNYMWAWAAMIVTPILLRLGTFLSIHFGKNILPAHAYQRLVNFADPFANAKDQGMQMVQSYYAISNGGLFGRGLGNSLQKRGYLPEAHTDFIFSIVVEELGALRAILILALLFFLISRIMLVGIRAKNPFHSLLCLGIGILFMTQVFINLGGVLGLIPLTGVTFPFLSQGGSSLLVLSIAVGMALNISAAEKRDLTRIEQDRNFKVLTIK
ncbi:FtsW/RodA/SpoVE family cell cycle protein [Enterococcus hirae]|nr:FtsW/RodA/SpoVE family cell cycle protein [Enterococcus hirae]